MTDVVLKDLPYARLHDEWNELEIEDKLKRFQELSTADAEEFFRELDGNEEAEILIALPTRDQRLWMRVLDPDDAADVIQKIPEEDRVHFLELLDESTRTEVSALMAYDEDQAGGLMSPRYARVRPDMTVDEALLYLRKQALEQVETVYLVYVLDSQQRLLGVVSVRRLFSSSSHLKVSDVMRTNVIKTSEDADQEYLSRLFQEHNLLAIPVVDSNGKMKGIVTIDDIVDVVEEEATEDIQKMGGSEALGDPYLKIALPEMIKKRGGWLFVLFLGELLTANAMGYFEDEISKAVILALFLPLIISSGGNAGSQASTLVVRAMALDEVKLRDWWKVMQREIIVGSSMGIILGVVGYFRVIWWEAAFHTYGQHAHLIGIVVGLSLVGIVLWGSVSGSILPFVLRRVGFDPASASTPFVATLVDVTGVVLYFSIASVILKGTLL
ncbi:MAG: magnesium transporter [Candidatus Melainabacteria bacterium]|nr:magnesium transporter [Candidatus Melainabacteria bacterium]